VYVYCENILPKHCFDSAKTIVEKFNMGHAPGKCAIRRLAQITPCCGCHFDEFKIGRAA
jgi:hypothetical protein